MPCVCRHGNGSWQWTAHRQFSRDIGNTTLVTQHRYYRSTCRYRAATSWRREQVSALMQHAVASVYGCVALLPSASHRCPLARVGLHTICSPTLLASASYCSYAVPLLPTSARMRRRIIPVPPGGALARQLSIRSVSSDERYDVIDQ